jgi:hypothetical protein
MKDLERARFDNETLQQANRANNQEWAKILGGFSDHLQTSASSGIDKIGKSGKAVVDYTIAKTGEVITSSMAYITENEEGVLQRVAGLPGTVIRAFSKPEVACGSGGFVAGIAGGSFLGMKVVEFTGMAMILGVTTPAVIGTGLGLTAGAASVAIYNRLVRRAGPARNSSRQPEAAASSAPRPQRQQSSQANPEPRGRPIPIHRD